VDMVLRSDNHHLQNRYYPFHHCFLHNKKLDHNLMLDACKNTILRILDRRRMLPPSLLRIHWEMVVVAEVEVAEMTAADVVVENNLRLQSIDSRLCHSSDLTIHNSNNSNLIDMDHNHSL
jgi:hypothetical protein